MNTIKMNDTASLIVIIDGTFEGVVNGSYDLQRTIKSYVEVNDVDGFNEDWITDNVEVYPLLLPIPLPLTYDVSREIDITIEDRGSEDITFLIEDLGQEFDSESDMNDWISDSITDGDYSVDEVKGWDIKRITSDYVDLEIEGDDEFELQVYGANKKVEGFIEAVEPTPINYSEMTSEKLLEHVMEIQAIVTARMNAKNEEESV